MTTKTPIFIHSLFRAGSTYLFNVFRRSPAGYYCYYEPLNEYLIYTVTDPDRLLDMGLDVVAQLRHPQLARPYFYEFHRIAPEVALFFRKGFSYDEYFLSPNDDISALKAYFELLIRQAAGTPVFQCCRTTGRLACLKAELGGQHIFIWRNPWDQWWSYKPGFDINNLLIANATHPPAFLAALKTELQIPDMHSSDTFDEYRFFVSQWLDSRGSFMLFYALWCHAMLEARTHCDMTISMDQLSISAKYRSKNLGDLARMGIRGLDLSDCDLPIGTYGEPDINFFAEIEHSVHKLLLAYGYSQAQLDDIAEVRDEFSPRQDTKKTAVSIGLMRDIGRARSMARDYETKLAHSWRTAVAENAERQSLARQNATLLTDLERAQADGQSLVQQINALENKASDLRSEAHHWWTEADRWWREADQQRQTLLIMYTSRSWRFTAPLRALHPRERLRDLVGRSIGFLRKIPGVSSFLDEIRSRYPRLWYGLSTRLKGAPVSPSLPAAPIHVVAAKLATSDEEKHFMDLFQREIARRQANSIEVEP